MKKLILSSLLFVFVASNISAQQYDDQSRFDNQSRLDDRTGYDGDFFSLEGALDLFKRSSSISDFERRLNREDSYVNNLDLDGDGQIDYIRVEHRRQGDFHAIILQVPFSRNDVQDVAVIEMEKIGRRNVILQIVGDEDLYGEEVVVEPFEGDSYVYREDAINVYNWRPVRNIFGRSYRPYVSPYYYASYPTWWRPWRPCGWNVFRPRIVIFHRHFHRARFHRVVHVHHFYRPYRSYSHHVFQRRNQVRGRRGLAPVRRDHAVAAANRKATIAKSPARTRLDNKNVSPARTRLNNKATSPARTRVDQSPNKSSKARTVEPKRQSTRQTPSRTRTESSRQQPSRTQKQSTPNRSQKSASPSRSNKPQSSSRKSASSSRDKSSKSNRPSASKSSRSSKSSAKRSVPSTKKSSSSRSTKQSKATKRGSRN